MFKLIFAVFQDSLIKIGKIFEGWGSKFYRKTQVNIKFRCRLVHDF